MLLVLASPYGDCLLLACVVPMPGVAPGRELDERLQDWCREKLAYFKAPRGLFFAEALREEPWRRPAILALRDRKKRRCRAPIAYWTLVH